jgi:hypothetical protein
MLFFHLYIKLENFENKKESKKESKNRKIDFSTLFHPLVDFVILKSLKSTITSNPLQLMRINFGRLTLCCMKHIWSNRVGRSSQYTLKEYTFPLFVNNAVTLQFSSSKNMLYDYFIVPIGSVCYLNTLKICGYCSKCFCFFRYSGSSLILSKSILQ